MTLPHPAAVGSYGAECASWSAERLGRPLRWWQKLALARLLEHDDAGQLVWITWLLSTARQVGKSYLLTELLLWRIHQAERFGEPQLVLHTGKDLPICRDVQRPARVWARAQGEGYYAREANGREEIGTPDGSRWLIRGKGSVYGYPVSLGAVDEVWKVNPEVVEDGIEPTMAERASPQLGLLSTAHRLATTLMPARRATAIAELMEPATTLLVEWSAPAETQLDDREAWRAASPHWSAGRERLIQSKLADALRGASDDPDDPDPEAAFRSQWLNIWPRQLVKRGSDEPLLAEGAWRACTDLSAEPIGPLVLGLEDYFGQGAAAAVAARTRDGRLLVYGRIAVRRSPAIAWLTQLAQRFPDSRLVVGASMADDPELAEIPVAAVDVAGTAQLRVSLPLLRELVGAGRVVHDGSEELTQQIERCRVVATAAGLGMARGSRTDLVRAASWALAILANQPAATDEPAIF